MISKRIETLVVNKCNIDVLINSFLKAHPQQKILYKIRKTK